MATRSTVKEPGRRDWGRLRKLPSGRWQAAYTHHGRVHPAPRTFPSETRAIGWLDAERRLIDLDAWTPPSDREAAKMAEQAAVDAAEQAASITLREFAKAWLKHRSDPSDPKPLAPRTSEYYQHQLDLYILPTLGDSALVDIDAQAVAQWHRDLGRKEIPSARAKAYSLLASIMSAAVDDPEIPLTESPCRVKGATSAPTKHRAAPATLDELDKLRAGLDALDSTRAKAAGGRYHTRARYGLMVDLAAWCALRFGEITELRRSDAHINTKDGKPATAVLRVRRGASFTRGKVHNSRTKTRASVRDVSVPPHIVDRLALHLAEHTGPDPDALLFPAPTGGNLRQGTFGAWWEHARKAAGRPDLHFHDLRHTGLTFAALAGATTRELMDRAGHTTPAMAMHYQHSAAGRDAQIADALSRIAKPGEDEGGPQAAAIRELGELVAELRSIIAEQASELARLREHVAEQPTVRPGAVTPERT